MDRSVKCSVPGSRERGDVAFPMLVVSKYLPWRKSRSTRSDPVRDMTHSIFACLPSYIVSRHSIAVAFAGFSLRRAPMSCSFVYGSIDAVCVVSAMMAILSRAIFSQAGFQYSGRSVNRVWAVPGSVLI